MCVVLIKKAVAFTHWQVFYDHIADKPSPKFELDFLKVIANTGYFSFSAPVFSVLRCCTEGRLSFFPKAFVEKESEQRHFKTLAVNYS